MKTTLNSAHITTLGTTLVSAIYDDSATLPDGTEPHAELTLTFSNGHEWTFRGEYADMLLGVVGAPLAEVR